MKELFNLGDLYVSDFIKDNELPRGDKSELKLFLTDDGNVRLGKSAPLDTMFGKYWYRSGTNQSMKAELKDIVDSIVKVKQLKENDIWLDIACNDGTLLSFVPKDLIKIGIDPVDDSYKVESSKHANIIVQDYFTAKNFKSTKYGNLKAKVVTSIAMFYDLEKPNEFIQDIKEIIDDNGMWVLQLSYTPLMLEQLAFDNICFKEGTYVMGANKPISQLNVGDEILGINGTITKVVKKFVNDFNGDLIKIKSQYLEEIECTPEHPILVLKKNNSSPTWTNAKNIEIGDYLVMPKIKTKAINRNIDLTKFNKLDSPHYRRGLQNIELTNDILWMMGMYVAEGHISGKPTNLQINFTLNVNEQNYANKIKKTFAKLGYKSSIRNSKISNAMNVQVSCTALARIFEEWFGKGALNKRIPDFIFSAEKDVTIPFLNGLINGDGSINNQVSLHSSSKKLVYQTQLMLATLNAMTGFSYVKPYDREIRGGKVKSKDSWQLRGKNIFLDEIFSTNHSKKRAKLRYKFDDNFVYVPVKKTNKSFYKGKVFNIETQNNTYVVSNAVVHNCHEHMFYYSLFNLKNLFEKNGFKIVDCQLNDTNGGSFRVYAMKQSADIKTFATQPYRDVCQFRINSILEYENTLQLDSVETWKKFYDRINDLKDKTVSFIKEKKAEGKTIWGYGASTKGNTLLQYFGLDNTLIDGIAERSIYKFGLKTVGTNITVYSEDEMRKAKPDYLLVLPWHFINEFCDRERDYLMEGGFFIVPCPKFEIIGKLKK